MELDAVIDMLKKADPKHVAPIGIGKPDSWRGSYCEIAFEPAENISVADMLSNALAAKDALFQGYKGGTYRMDGNTECHVARWGEYGGSDDALTPLLLSYMAGLR